MDAMELLKNWPEWRNANAARVLSSPAWRLETRYGGKAAVLTRSGETPLPRIDLAITLDGAAAVLSVAICELFPELWLLRERLDALPREVKLALVERECGPLFQFFEDTWRQSFSVSGIADEASKGLSFALASEAGEVRFTVDVPSSVELAFGQLPNLDPAHGSIRSMRREIAATYGALEMSDGEVAALGAGDCLVMSDAAGSWGLGVPDDGLVRIVAAGRREATFAEIADDALGPVPPGSDVKVYHRGKEIASGVFAKLGEATVVKII